MAARGSKKSAERELPLKKGHYRRAYWLKDRHTKQLKIRAAIEDRDPSVIVQDALDMYFAAHPNQLR